MVAGGPVCRPLPARPPFQLRGYYPRMAFAIYRVSKLKSIGALRGSAAHNARTRETPNADVARRGLNQQLIGFAGKIPAPAEFVAEWELRTRKLHRKRDAVLAQELFLGASPEFFDDVGGEERGARVNEWARRSVVWLQRTFGAQCFSATLHLDEKTPHIAAFIIPQATSKDGKQWLSAKRLFNPVTLRKQQDTYAATLAGLGLERGIRGSTAKHETIATFYGSLAKHSGLTPVEVSERERPLIIPERHFLQGHAAYAEQVRTTVADHLAPIHRAAEKHHRAATLSEHRRRRLLQSQATNRALAERLSVAETELKTTVTGLRDIPLAEVLTRFGFGMGERRRNATVWDTGDHVISIAGDAVGWTDIKVGVSGRKAIDLTEYLMGCGYLDAVAWLAGLWSQEKAAAAVCAAANDQVAALHPKTTRTLWDHFATPEAAATEQVRTSLSRTFMLSLPVIDSAISDARLHGSRERRVNGRLNDWAVFCHYGEGKIRGATLLDVAVPAGARRILGDCVDSFFSAGRLISNADRIALVRGPISALSYAQLYPTHHVISVATPEVPPALTSLAASTDLPVVFGFPFGRQSDEAWAQFLRAIHAMGTRAAGLLGRVIRTLPQVSRYLVSDWNHVLRGPSEVKVRTPNRIRTAVSEFGGPSLPSL